MEKSKIYDESDQILEKTIMQKVKLWQKRQHGIIINKFDFTVINPVTN